jgi:cadmium resistance protein CadD (predicted permease)
MRPSSLREGIETIFELVTLFSIFIPLFVAKAISTMGAAIGVYLTFFIFINVLNSFLRKKALAYVNEKERKQLVSQQVLNALKNPDFNQ